MSESKKRKTKREFKFEPSEDLDWWLGTEPIYRDRGDGQNAICVYARVSPFAPEATEYIVVVAPVGHEQEYGVPSLAISDFEVRFLNASRLIQGPE